MITKSEAIEIAKKAIVGKMKTQEGSPITAELQNDEYVITFVHINPPGVRGPDYNARVTINAQSGIVKGLLVGS